MPDLATVDLPGVEILAADVTIHGIGSPPEGDCYTTQDLRAMADAAAELGNELRAPVKIGHDHGGLATGWLTNQRVAPDGKKLLADLKKVPAKVAALIRSGALRGRSAEISRVRSQATGRSYEAVVSAVALLGSKMPAARTLEDVVRLYESNGTSVEVRRVFSFEDSGPSGNGGSLGLEDSASVRQYVDSLVLAGRIPREEREPWARAFATNPQLAETWLADDHPDPFADQPAWTDEDVLAGRFGLDTEAMI